MYGANRIDYIKKLIIDAVVSLICAILMAVIVTGHLWQIGNIGENLANLRVWTSLNRAYILFFIFFYMGLHFIFDVKKMYEYIFDKRWLVGAFLLLFLTVNQYHGDSISYYNEVIQPGMGDDSAYPILGKIRPIRSDEYIVDTPSALASGYGEHPYGKYNEVMRGTKTLNVATGIYGGYVTLAMAPWKLSYLILPREYAFSFCWYAPIILGFLMSIELFYIITGKQKLLSVTGGFLVIFSAFYLWWGFSTYFVSAPGTVICVYYFLKTHEFWKKNLLGLGMAVCFSCFILNLYPAWQVPLGYMFLAVGIWVLHENWSEIKKMRLKEWLIIVGAILLVLSFVGAYYYVAKEYIEAVSSTVYPGKRISTGSYLLNKLFYYAQAPFYAYKEVGNASEAGVFFSLFPIPTIMAVYSFLKKRDWLIGGLLLAQIPMLVYVTVGFPEVVAQLSLFSHTMAARTIDIIGLIQIYFIIIILSREETVKLPIPIAVILGVMTAGISVKISNNYFPGYLNTILKIGMLCVITGACVCLMIRLSEKMKLCFLLSLIGLSLFTGIYVRPVTKGLSAIYSKPVAKEIKEICENDEDAKWVAIGDALSAYSVACGAPTINSVNRYPNLKLWTKLDMKGEYEDVYNRYAHVDVQFTNEETSFELIYPDCMKLNLSYKDIRKTEVSYLLLAEEMDLTNEYVQFDEVYKEDGIAIYAILY